MIYLAIVPFFPDSKSFHGPFIYDQVCAIKRSGRFRKVIVLKPCTWFHRPRKYSYDGQEVVYVPRIELPSLFLNGFFSFINDFLLIKTLDKEGINVSEIFSVHIHASIHAHYGVKLKKLNSSIKTIIQYHSLDPLQALGCKAQQWGWHQRMCVSQRVKWVSGFDLHVGVSRKVIDQLVAFPGSAVKTYHEYMLALKLLERIPRVTIKDSYVLYNGVDEKKFFPIAKRKSQPDTFRIGCVANFTDLKSQIVLLKALKVLIECIAEIRVIFIGSGPELQNCIGFVNKNNLGNYVDFLAAVDHRELNAFYNSLDLFVLPSLFEGLGCVFLEAYSCGVPFICVREQGISEFIDEDDANKWLINANDTDQLVARILNYYEHRLPQRIVHSIDLDYLVGMYLDKILKM